MGGNKSQEIADKLIEQLDEWYSLPEAWDNDLDRQIAKWYADAPNVWPKRPYFSPSAATACPRSLYFKAKRAKKDAFPKPPYQGRWQAIGTAIGTTTQRDILAMERNMPGCPFRFERTERGEPMFEDFAKKNTEITHNGRTFYAYGTCDGILEYIDPETGEVTRVGLEIKSKQTTAAQTGFYKMSEPNEKHVKQCAVYSDMYNVDYYVILYVNASKKSWEYPEGEYEKSPDIRAFGLTFSQADKAAIYDRFADILSAVEAGTPPPLSIEDWTFNGFKTACAESLTDEELSQIERTVSQVKRSRLPDYVKANYIRALAEIEALRNGE
ncbi:hypothetical protein [Alteribacter populi]|uniref:hypothetical protein n=1 Tax=Alteribacter populi TaxID=2011011 RepID=UPI000BBA8F5A|nr:hypothetical protein [Alteribacter populi]